MKKFKIFMIIIASILALIYMAFLTVVPNIVNLNNYKSDIQKLINDNAKLNIDYKNLSYTTTFNLGVKLKADDLKLSYLDNDNTILEVEKVNATVPLLPLFVKIFKVSSVNIQSPKININIDKNGVFDIEKYINENFMKTVNTDDKTQLPVIISDIMPVITIKNYVVNVDDKQINQITKLTGEMIKIENFVLNKHIKVSADGDLTSNDEHFIKYNMKISSFLPEIKENDKKDENAQLSLFNPFGNLIKHKFKSDVYADLKISQKNDDILLDGELNVDKTTIKSGGVILPESYLHLNFKNKDIQINSNFYTAKNEKMFIDGEVNFGKKTKIDLNVKNESIKISNAKNVLAVVLDILNIENELNLLNVDGYFTADFNIKTDLKKIQSKGQLLVKNCKITHKKFPVKIDKIQAMLNFADNKVEIKNTSALVGGSKLDITGYIDDNAEADIKITTNKLPLKTIYQTFASESLKKSYMINNGILSLNAYLKGKLSKITPSANLDVENILIKDKSLNSTYSLKTLKGDLVSKDDEYSGLINIKNAQILMPAYNLHLTIPISKINIDDKDIVINPTTINMDNSQLTFDGKVNDYLSSMEFDGVLKGKLNANSLRAYLPKEIRQLTKANGNLPTMMLIKSNGKTTQISAQVGANSNNYFTPIEINEMKYHNSVLNFDAALADNSFNINDLGLYSLNYNYNISNNFQKNLANSSKVISVIGKVNNLSSNAEFSNFKAFTSKNVTLSIPSLPNSSATFSANMSLDGQMSNPQLKGQANLKNLYIPTYNLTANNFNINMNKDKISGDCQNMNLNGSLIGLNFDAKNDFSSNFIINNLTLNSNYIDLDKIFTVLNNMPQSDYAPSSSLPVVINNGTLVMNKFLMGDIVATNVSSNFSLKNNIFTLPNIKANAYQGSVTGNMSYNIPYLNLKVNMLGNNLDFNQAMSTFAGVKDQFEGQLNLKANISMVGSNYTQQMRTLKGNASFNVQNGQMGNLGKFEYYLHAQNLISSKFFNLNLNSLINTISSKNTGKFAYLKGDMTFNNGYVHVSSITSSGPNMSLYMSGTYNLLNNLTNIELLGKISQDVNQSLGVVGELSLNKLLTIGNNKFGVYAVNLLQNYNVQTSKAQLNKIPALTPSTNTAVQAFQVRINGILPNVSAVKSFKWLTTEDVTASANTLQMNMPKAVTTVTTQIQHAANQIKSGMNMTPKTYVPTTTYQKTTTQKGTATSSSNVNVEIPDFIKALPDTFKN